MPIGNLDLLKPSFHNHELSDPCTSSCPAYEPDES